VITDKENVFMLIADSVMLVGVQGASGGDAKIHLG